MIGHAQAHAQQRLQAHSTFHAALRRGDIIKPRRCAQCGRRPEQFLLRAHHEDHAQPLVVEWLCSKCHGTRNLEAHLSKLFSVEEWSALVAKAKRDGVSLRSLILGWLKKWVEEP